MMLMPTKVASNRKILKMKYLIKFFSSPYLLSLIPFVLVAALIHSRIRPYLLEIEGTVTLTRNTYVWYEDLDNDGLSETIVAENQPTSTALAISTGTGIVNQFGFRGDFNFFKNKCLFITGDKNNDGIKEIYAFTLSGDSIFLHSIDNYKDSQITVRNRFIATTGPGLKSPDPFIIPAEMEDLDNDGIKELIFGIGSGFSLFPRRVYAYFTLNDSLVSSPESSYFIWGIMQKDITGDGIKEIIPYGYATSNISRESAKYHDCSSFLMVLGQDLQFLFPPLEFAGRYSKVTPFTIKKAGADHLGLLYNTASGLTQSMIYLVNPRGTLTDSIQLPFYAVDCQNTSFRGNNNMFLMSLPKNRMAIFNSDFHPVRNISVETMPNNILQIDPDLDGKNEILMIFPGRGNIQVYREGLLMPASLPVSMDGANNEIVSLKTDKSSDPLISIQSGQKQYLIRYRNNPLEPYYFLYYPGIYLAILAFALTVKNIQKNQIKKKHDNEDKIAQLQLALIKSQLDPHFTLNAINSIIYSLEYSDMHVAGDQLRRFANLYRNLLLSATSVQWSIGEELDFCSDYLMLEKMRFGDIFDYEITGPEYIKNSLPVPKLFIQIHVENAIKHGLSMRYSGGILKIDIRRKEDSLIVEITDNGIGRKESRKLNRVTTAKGLEIMNELYSIYNKYYNEKISYEVIDLYHDNGNASGTRVNIRISNALMWS